MERLFNRALLPRAAAGLLLVVTGAIGFAVTAPDSWIGLAALLAHLSGLVLLYAATRIWMDRFGGRARLAATQRPQQGCAVALLRIVLIASMVGAAGFWLWCTVVDLNEMRLLLSGARFATAQVTGKDIVPAKDPTGYIYYSYRVSRTLAPEDRFAVPYPAYPRYRMGQPIEVTYAAGAPRVHRLGRVDWQYALRRLLYWLLFLANGAAYLYLPLWLLEFRRPPPGTPPPSLASPMSPSK
jgi:hypothetical protein